MIKAYYELTKPGLVWGNLITTLAGFLFASRLDISWPLLFGTLVGAALVIASACVFNNIYDREADSKMSRTRHRALPSGAIRVSRATAFASALSCIGFALLFFGAGFVPGFVALAAFVVYVRIYSPLKYLSHWAALIGGFAGASPILIGYTAVSGQIDMLAALLFLSMVLWQMPHFYAIALFRRGDYAAAGTPVLSIIKGNRHVYVQIVIFIALYIIAVMSLTFFGYTGILFLASMAMLGGVWFGFALAGLRDVDNIGTARRIFFISIAVMVSFSIMISFASVLP